MFRVVTNLIQDCDGFPMAALLVTSSPLRSVLVPRVSDTGRSRQHTGKGRLAKLLFTAPSSIIFSPHIVIDTPLAASMFLKRVKQSLQQSRHCERWSLQVLDIQDDAHPENSEFAEAIGRDFPRVFPLLDELRIATDGDETPEVVKLVESIAKLRSLRHLSFSTFFQHKNLDLDSKLFATPLGQNLKTLFLHVPGTPLPLEFGTRLLNLRKLELDDYRGNVSSTGLCIPMSTFRHLNDLKITVHPSRQGELDLSFLHRARSDLLSRSLHSLEIRDGRFDAWAEEERWQQQQQRAAEQERRRQIGEQRFPQRAPGNNGALSSSLTTTTTVVSNSNKNLLLFSIVDSLQDCCELERLVLYFYQLPPLGRLAQSFRLLTELQLRGNYRTTTAPPPSTVVLNPTTTTAAPITVNNNDDDNDAAPLIEDFALADLLRATTLLRKCSLNFDSMPLPSSPASNNAMDALSSLQFLEELTLNRVGLTTPTQDEPPLHLGFRTGFPQLRTVRLFEVVVGEIQSLVLSLGCLPKLETLDIELITNLGTKPVRNGAVLKQLKELNSRLSNLYPSLVDARIANRVVLHGIEHIVSAPKVSRVDLWNFPVLEEHKLVERVGPSVSCLRARNSHITAMPIIVPTTHTKLVILDLRNNFDLSPSLAHIAALAKCKALVELDLSSTAVADVTPLADSKSLRKLVLYEATALTSSGLRGVERIPTLKEIDIWLCRGVDDISFLSGGAKSLETVRAWGVGVKSVDGFSGLWNLPRLARLEVDALFTGDRSFYGEFVKRRREKVLHSS